MKAALPAPLTVWFHDEVASGSQPCRIHGPMSPVEMKVPGTNQRLTITLLMRKTAKYGRPAMSRSRVSSRRRSRLGMGTRLLCPAAGAQVRAVLHQSGYEDHGEGDETGDDADLDA